MVCEVFAANEESPLLIHLVRKHMKRFSSHDYETRWAEGKRDSIRSSLDFDRELKMRDDGTQMIAVGIQWECKLDGFSLQV